MQHLLARSCIGTLHVLSQHKVDCCCLSMEKHSRRPVTSLHRCLTFGCDGAGNAVVPATPARVPVPAPAPAPLAQPPPPPFSPLAPIAPFSSLFSIGSDAQSQQAASSAQALNLGLSLTGRQGDV